MIEGEIEEKNSFDSMFGHNLATNETIVGNDRNANRFYSMPASESLFGLSDVDLRFDPNANAFNDCDERLVANTSGRQRHENPNAIYARNANILNSNLRPHLNESIPMSFSGNRFDSRPPMPSFLSAFRPENSMPFRMRPQMPSMNALLPTPNAMPLRHLPPNQLFRPIRPPIGPDFDASNYRHSPQQFINCNPCPPPTMPYMSDPLLQGRTHTPEAKGVTSFVISNDSHSNIPFICDTNENAGQRPEETIVLETDNDITEVEMPDAADLSPYDPEEDITYLCTISPTKDSQSVKQNNSNLSLNEKKKSESNTRTGVRNDSAKQAERLNRKRSSNKISKPLTPRRDNRLKSSQTSKSSSKSIVHKKMCRKNVHKSRRETKRVAKRQVVAYKVEQRFADLRPKPRNNMNESSYEDLLEEYERLKDQLKELENEEKNNETIVSVIDVEEEENIAKLVKSDDIFEISNESKENEENDREGDDEEHELRRLALASKKKREIQEQENEELRLRQQLLNALHKSKAKLKSESPDDWRSQQENEELRLRQQLLNALHKSKAKLKSESPVNQKDGKEMNALIVDIDSNPSEQNSNSESIFVNRSEVQTPVNVNSEIENIIKTSDQIPLKPIPKLIINFGDDSTDEEQDINGNSFIDNVPQGLDSFLRQARLRSEPKTKSGQSLLVLSNARQKELQELRAEIKRRELNLINDKKLHENELLLKSANETLMERISKRNLLKNRVTLKRNALRKAQIQARKMQEAFIAATRVVSATASEFHSFNDELKNIEVDVKQEINNINNYKKECLRMGTKLKGVTYRLPTGASFRRSNSTSISSNKKDPKVENNSLLREDVATEMKKRLQQELMQKLENCSKLLNLKKANHLRPSSPNPFVLKTTQNLLGSCNDEKCLGQHINKCLLNPTNKIVDLLLYEPKIAGIASEIPERIDNELKRSKQPVVCLMTRRIPKLFNTPKLDVPFDDLMYRFNIKDKTLVINKTTISELKLSADPDIYIKNRFFAPEGVPISAQLETTLASDPSNIQLWSSSLRKLWKPLPKKLHLNKAIKHCELNDENALISDQNFLYILYLEMECNCSQQIDSAFQKAIALSSVDGTDSKDLQLLWSKYTISSLIYLEFCVKNMKNEKQFMDLFESVRHCCLTISDPSFQSQVIKFLCQMLSNEEKSKALIQFAKAIGLSIERDDHLSVHKFFQIAISLMPYNSIIWQNFKTYETLIRDHLS
ncbi:unnamed protein product [Medioppia subpectinata]|uniref:Uncharacterized protein n=1 Tax=Medioppia subpectinata TaxID=1979941 RepID=A0A7R9PXI4_9ACAR|nr:unnamed protein product [Medioppia subpectinata]CAG2104416.1 unnamed protein product [Medioppia subpectinata]